MEAQKKKWPKLFVLTMTHKTLKKELYQLMAASLSIQSLRAAERLEMQDRMLDLPESDMQQMVQILKQEQEEMKKLHKRSKLEQKQIKKIDNLVEGLRDAGHIMDKAFLTARESEEQTESSKISADLLKEIDMIE